MAASGDEVDDEEYEALAYQQVGFSWMVGRFGLLRDFFNFCCCIFQRLKAALHFTVGRICENTGEDNKSWINREPDRISTKLQNFVSRFTWGRSYNHSLGCWKGYETGGILTVRLDFRIPNARGLQCFCCLFTKLNEISVKWLQPSLILKKIQF